MKKIGMIIFANIPFVGFLLFAFWCLENHYRGFALLLVFFALFSVQNITIQDD